MIDKEKFKNLQFKSYKRIKDENGNFVLSGRNKCIIEGCSKNNDSFGYCSTHRNRIEKHGDPHYTKPIMSKEERLQKRRESQKKYKKTKKGFISENNYKKSNTGRSTKRKSCERRRSRIKKATPPWANIEEINQFYKNKPNGLTVDHIHPLYGTNSRGEHISCGLHVIWNLQYLPKIENSKKGNKII